ncbi:conserved protein of unknown function (plasmid) [Cupriavidus taiwanensis]|uniref:Uncharacterized protein n=1 Tax=Cupriavidus taiwanensis TaxID=164546 RepID=A0A375IT04_9BURK|nr:hypothetical protein [Cupriavidus taiwanensis]SPK77308.1 conserved protein of unknown function [Cupriavidus taiwanensis]
MALTGDQISIITELIRKESSLPEVAAKWQSCYPDVRVIRVSELEMRYERPVIELAGRRVYFGASTGVCISITSEPSHANMLILTENWASNEDG